MSDYSVAAAKKSADAIAKRIGGGVSAPTIGIVLGSGLGGLADVIGERVEVPYADVPGFTVPRAEGHAGKLVSGRLGGKSVVALSGRFHVYEGHPPALAGFPMRVLKQLGVETVFLSNAAGAVNEDYRAGDLMIIADHLNLMWTNPLVGEQQPGEERFTDMSEPYDASLRDLLRKTAAKLGIELREGVYAALPGPSYETRAEVKMLRTLGADAVGMSTVPEVLVARALGMRVAAISAITNAVSGAGAGPLVHADVLDVSRRISATFQRLVSEFLAALPKES
jgi:purine-nucleoside phosphorylase